ncbi:MAG: response regulator transcription factor [Acidimicrobiales bacterium]
MDTAVAERTTIRVVVVDDHQMFVESLVRLLDDEADIEVVAVAGSSRDALASVHDTKPDVVVMDYQLPDESGARATAVLRHRDPGVRVVMLTGHADTSAARAAAEVGCVAFVTKDKAAQDLVDAVRAAHAGVVTLAQPAVSVVPGWDGRRAARLSRREREVLRMLADGLGTEAISEALFISRNTVRAHVQRVISKLGAHSKLEAVAIARRSGLL